MKVTIMTVFTWYVICFFVLTATALAQAPSPCTYDPLGNQTGNCGGASSLTGGGSGATLQSILESIYGVFDTYIIPFLISIAVVAFVVNVTRYFILKSDSEDGRESARRYLIWSLLGFVVIFAFWGIVNLIIVLFGFSSFGGIVCPDYDPTCNPSGIAVGPTPGNSFAGGGPVVPIGPGVNLGTGGGSPNTGGASGGLGNPGGSDSPPIAPGTTSGDYSTVGANVQARITASLATTNSFLSVQLSQISDPNISDDSRLRTALSFANAGIITQAELSQIVVDINLIRTNQGQTPLSLSAITPSAQYTNNIQNIYQNLPTVRSYFEQYYTSNGLPIDTATNRAQADMQNVFNTNNTFATRVNTAADIMLNVMEGDPEHPAFIPLLLALNAEARYAGCGEYINSTNLFQAPCG